MDSTTKGRMNQVLSILPQAEHDEKGQVLQVLRAFENEIEPRKPVEISNNTGIKGPNVRRIIQILVRSGQLRRDAQNKYSIIS